MTKPIQRLALILLAAMTIGCDQGTKYFATVHLIDKPMQSFFADIFRLVYAQNTGGFLSLGAHWPETVRTALFTVGTGGVLMLFLILMLRFQWRFWQLAGLTFFVAGGASNWVDRALRGSVVDFMNLGIGSLRTGIFNIADAAILLGIALWLIPGFGGKPKIPPHPEPSPF